MIGWQSLVGHRQRNRHGALLIGGALPALESLFRVTTNISWLELADLNHPLLRRMTIEAPGTYHHSLVVAQLAEAAAEAIGANPTIARVCSYFHDIGKLVKPEYFTENMRYGRNPHDDLAPTMSALIIIAHVKEGVDLALKHGLNQQIMDVIQQHHGTSLVYYFYKRALQQQEDARQGGKIMNIREEDIPEVREESFRYPGPRPQTRECAIISLADGIESASRCMERITPQKIDQLIDDIIEKRLLDGQLSECDLTMRELGAVAESFKNTLHSMMHSRVAYPSDQKAEKTEKRGHSDADPGRAAGLRGVSHVAVGHPPAVSRRRRLGLGRRRALAAARAVRPRRHRSRETGDLHPPRRRAFAARALRLQAAAARSWMGSPARIRSLPAGASPSSAAVPELLGPQAEFAQHGASGAWVSERLPELAGLVDEIAFIKTMRTEQFNHAPAQLFVQTGSAELGRPSFGSWVTYGLGSANENLPAFMVLLSGGKTPDAGKSIWGSGFLPAVYQGVQCQHRRRPDPLCGKSARRRAASSAAQTLDTRCEALDQEHYEETGDPEILTRIEQYELAFRMQISVPEAMEIAAEPEAVRAAYGATPGENSFANNCLLARRLAERGVRFIQLYDWGWDSHGIHRVGRPARRLSAQDALHRPPARRAAARSEAARTARRDARRLDRRIRPHADDGKPRRQAKPLPRPRPPPARLHRVAGRRRRPRAATRTAKRMSLAAAPCAIPSTCTTSRPPSCACSASITRSSPIPTKAAITVSRT